MVLLKQRPLLEPGDMMSSELSSMLATCTAQREREREDRERERERENMKLA